MEYYLFGVNVWNYSQGVIVFVAAMLILKFIKVIVLSRLEKLFQKTKTNIDDAIIGSIKKIGWPLYTAFSLLMMSQFSDLPPVVDKWIYNIFLVTLVFYVIQFISRLIDFGTKRLIQGEGKDENTGIINLISLLVKILLWVGAIVLILANMGYNVTSLIAGLGIGGIAIGLALQNVLGDLFSSLAIYLDKPFKIGDFIIVGDKMGTVKHVGIKTTRVSALQGEELVFCNTDMTNSRIQNFGKMEKRRVVFNIGVAYSTPHEKLRKIPGILKTAIEATPKCHHDRSNFNIFGESSLNYETVYFIATGDYNEYMDSQENINLSIIENFEKEGIEIAFPTRTVYLKREE